MESSKKRVGQSKTTCSIRKVCHLTISLAYIDLRDFVVGEKSKGLVTDETVYELTAEDVIGTHHKILTLDDDVESSTKS